MKTRTSALLRSAKSILLLASLLGLAACAGVKTEPKRDAAAILGRGEQDQVSTLPWNRPEQWEGTGALGGMANSGLGGQGAGY